MKWSRRFVLLLSLWLVTLIIDTPYLAWGGPSPVAPINTTEGLALKGYDPIAYFTTGQPTQGVNQFTYLWQGTTYRFASAENLERFKGNIDSANKNWAVWPKTNVGE